MKEAQLVGIHPSMRDARVRGIPFFGPGKIYPVPIEVIEIAPFEIPRHWPRGFGLDVGYGRTAAIWGALDRDTDILYLYSEHYVAEEQPAVHAAAIMGNGTEGALRGKWIRGVCDPNAKGRSQRDGISLMQNYKNLGMDLEIANSAVWAGIDEVWLRLSSGRLKVFSTLQFFFKEYVLYRRNDKGEIVKKNDHLMDAMRYLVMSGLSRATTEPLKMEPSYKYPRAITETSWMAS